MINKKFLSKAESLKPELITEAVSIAGRGKPLQAGDVECFDFGNHYVGSLLLEISTAGHHYDAPLLLQLNFAEIPEEFEQEADGYNGWISKSWVQEERIHVDILPGVVELKRRYAFRYVRVKVLAASENYSVVINKATVTAVSSADYSSVTYPEFCDVDRKLDQVSLRTLHECMQEVFEDGPKRDRRLWLGDLRLQALANYQTFKNNGLVKRCLYLFAASTLEEGRLSSNIFIEPAVECDDQTMFDYTLFFINTLWDYYEATDDIDTLGELEPVCLRQYELLKKCFDSNDVIDLNKSGRVFVDWNFDLDKEASGQAIYVYALKDLVKIEEELGRNADEIKKDIILKENAARKMYDQQSGVFVSGRQRQVSVAAQVWMILAGIVDADTASAILNNVETIESAVKLNSPFAYHFYIQALIDAGMKEKAYAKMHEYWGGMISKGADTFWEIYNPQQPLYSPYGGLLVHSFCHAWSCTPTYFLRKYYYSGDRHEL